MGIIFAVTRFHRYIYGRFFTLQMDHKLLLTIFGSKKGLPVYTANRLLRWCTILLNYNFRLEYLPTKKIGHADGLSRIIPTKTEPLEDSVIAALRHEEDIRTVLCCTVRNLPVTLQEIKNEAINDEFIKETKAKIAEKISKYRTAFLYAIMCYFITKG